MQHAWAACFVCADAANKLRPFVARGRTSRFDTECLRCCPFLGHVLNSERELARHLAENTCYSPPYRPLYCGRMASGKGLPDLINAVTMLIADGQDVALDRIGPPERRDSALEILGRLGRRPEIRDRIVYHGPKTLGQELFQMCRRADMFVIASTSDAEGFPRVIWEAMAQSLPVVATRVASIPHYLKHLENAVLAEPKDPVGLASAIESVITNTLLRKQLIQNGLAHARGNTLELRASELMRNLQSWLATRSCA